MAVNGVGRDKSRGDVELGVRVPIGAQSGYVRSFLICQYLVSNFFICPLLRFPFPSRSLVFHLSCCPLPAGYTSQHCLCAAALHVADVVDSCTRNSRTIESHTRTVNHNTDLRCNEPRYSANRAKTAVVF